MTTFNLIGLNVAAHYRHLHPDIDVIRHGQHYRAYPAPLRCDFCTSVVELPYWTHSADPPLALSGQERDNDGRWLLCQPCHGLLVTGDALGMVTRHWDVGVVLTPVALRHPQMKIDIQTTVLAQVTQMMQSLDGGIRHTVG